MHCYLRCNSILKHFKRAKCHIGFVASFARLDSCQVVKNEVVPPGEKTKNESMFSFGVAIRVLTFELRRANVLCLIINRCEQLSIQV